jgi:peptide/nickel transport system ATP-binding protein
MTESVLRVESLATEFATEAGTLRVVDDVSFDVAAGRTLGVVGESGCGKSVTALSIMGLLPKPAGRVVGGRVLLDGEDLLRQPARALRAIRGRRIAMVFQEPMTALNPVQRIGRQLIEALRLHAVSGDLRHRAVALLREVGIPEPERRLDEYPHELSGGMRQRVLIAIALACQPDVLIADEPTTALDVTIQAQILELLQRLQRDHGMAMILITHDLGVIAEIADDVLVMYAGRVVEQADVATLFRTPLHPYTRGLLASTPRLQRAPKSRLATIPGMVPALNELPAGCRFGNRCERATPACAVEPPLTDVGVGHRVACVHWRRSLS